MRPSVILLIFTVVLFAGCRSPKLEREDIPLHWGLRFEGEDAMDLVHEDLKYGGRGKEWMIEVPVVAGDDYLPRISPPFPLDSLTNLLREQKMVYSLAFTTSFSNELFPDGVEDDPSTYTGGHGHGHGHHWHGHGDEEEDIEEEIVEEPVEVIDTVANENQLKGAFADHFSTPEQMKLWFEALTQELLGNLVSIDWSHGPERVIVGNDWKTVEGYGKEWEQMMDRLRYDLKGLKIGYGFHGDRSDPPAWVSKADFFALEYPPVADENPKPFAIQNNPRMASFASDRELPLFIYRSNIMGKHKTIGLQNRLRFWVDELPVTGLVANSLYAKIPPLDSTSYFGVMTDEEFLAYWDSYQSQK